MKLFVGLGNPGAKYAGNRHNIGYLVVEAIHRKHPFGGWSRKFKAEISEGEIGGERILLIKPQTFMNLSGESVGEAMRFYKLAPSDIVVFHDELDLPAGKVKVKTGGGHGGHNGLKSIDAHCGRDYVRVRLGIGHPGVKEMVHNHVLGDFSKADQSWLAPLLDDIALAAGLLLEKDPSRFMNKISPAVSAPQPKPPREKQGASEKPGQQSHIHQARDHKPKLPTSGPMAEMLKKMFGKG